MKADDKESEEIKVTKNNDTEESEKKVEPESESEVVANAESLEQQQKWKVQKLLIHWKWKPERNLKRHQRKIR